MDKETYVMMWVVTSAAMSVYFLWPVLVIIKRSVIAWLDDGKPEKEVKLLGFPERDWENVTFYSLMTAMSSWLVGILWPLLYILVILTILGYVLRFLIRCGKSITKLSQVAHTHDSKGSPEPTYVEKPSFRDKYS